MREAKAGLSLDLKSLIEEGLERFSKNFLWPTAHSFYVDIERENLEMLYSIYSGTEGTERTAFQLQFREIFLAFNSFACNIMDVQGALKAGKTPVAGSDSPFYLSIMNDSFPKAAPRLIPKKKGLTEGLKKFIRNYQRALENKLNGFKDADFVSAGLGSYGQHYCRVKGIEYRILPPEIFGKTPSFSYYRKEVEKLSHRIYEGWIGILKNKKISPGRKAMEYLKKIPDFYLSRAMRDISRKALKFKPDTVLLSDTGASYINRIAGLKIREAGGRVIRFDHGGERAFHSDRWWGINELVFCDEFVTFSPIGAETLQKKIRAKDIYTLLDEPEKLEISSCTYRFDDIFNIVEEKHGTGKSIEKVMLVPVGFQGEFNGIPSSLVHDVPYADMQIRLIRALKDSGYEVLYKFAPKVSSGYIFPVENLEVQRVEGFLSDCLDMADAFIFTYVGTAFCEALCTEKPVLLLQASPYRRMGEKERKELYSSCRAMDCTYDESNRIVFDAEKLKKMLIPMSTEEVEARKDFVKKWLCPEAVEYAH